MLYPLVFQGVYGSGNERSYCGDGENGDISEGGGRVSGLSHANYLALWNKSEEEQRVMIGRFIEGSVKVNGDKSNVNVVSRRGKIGV